MLFLALKKVRFVKITPPQVPTTQQKIPSTKLPIPSLNTIRKTLYERVVSFFEMKLVFRVSKDF